jgi:hypothetical protein
MPHTIKLAPERYSGLRPANPVERRSLLKVCALTTSVVAFAIGLWLLQQHWRQVRELTWKSADGLVEDARPVLVAENATLRGGAMLYRVEVLAQYRVDGVDRERWIAVSQRPEALGDAQFQAFQWKGSKCVVRWNPADGGQAAVEIGGRPATFPRRLKPENRDGGDGAAKAAPLQGELPARRDLGAKTNYGDSGFARMTTLQQ